MTKDQQFDDDHNFKKLIFKSFNENDIQDLNFNKRKN